MGAKILGPTILAFAATPVHRQQTTRAMGAGCVNASVHVVVLAQTVGVDGAVAYGPFKDVVIRKTFSHEYWVPPKETDSLIPTERTGRSV